MLINNVTFGIIRIISIFFGLLITYLINISLVLKIYFGNEECFIIFYLLTQKFKFFTSQPLNGYFSIK